MLFLDLKYSILDKVHPAKQSWDNIGNQVDDETHSNNFHCCQGCSFRLQWAESDINDVSTLYQ